MRILTLSAALATLALTCLNDAHAGQNCMLINDPAGEQECFDRTFSTTPAKTDAALPDAKKTPRPKLSQRPKTRNASNGALK